jgi:multidrug transporter EmrE-like cation transporter
MGLPPLLGGILLSLVESVGDFSLKKYAITDSKGFLGIGVAVYTILAGILGWLMKTNGLAIVNAFWDATSNVLTMALGGLVFNETYTVRQWIGMVVVTLGIFMMDGGL